MAIIRLKSGEIQCKIVYYGPGQSGKTTNLITIHKSVGRRARGELISINTTGDRTIFFDLLPLDLGTIRDMGIKISVYTVPGQVHYNDTRKLVLKGCDGIVFVADSSRDKRNENIDSLVNLDYNLREMDRELAEIPLVLQYNKRDLNRNGVRTLPLDVMDKDLNPTAKLRRFGASALYGDGVKDTFKAICMLTVADVCRQLI
ncbi:MAG: GTPase domain-containing protein [Desulfomonilaceae bacterium]|nr:GTPase domain-containing protein [Desulfomonilaceae bacterium]